MLDIPFILGYINQMKTSMFAVKIVGLLVLYAVMITVIHEITAEHRITPTCKQWKSSERIEYINTESGVERVVLRSAECTEWTTI